MHYVEVNSSCIVFCLRNCLIPPKSWKCYSILFLKEVLGFTFFMKVFNLSVIVFCVWYKISVQFPLFSLFKHPIISLLICSAASVTYQQLKYGSCNEGPHTQKSIIYHYSMVVVRKQIRRVGIFLAPNNE